MAPEEVKLKRLAYWEDPRDFLKESETIVWLMFPHLDFSLIRRVFGDIERLFSGKYPGYRRCTTRYHDLNHTLHCFLLMARLMHGAFINGIIFKEENVVLGLISALLHDTGYIQLVGDRTGTGGKCTLVHIERSVEFMEKYFINNGFALRDYIFCRDCLKCTGINVKIKNIQFESHEHEILGKILGTADLIGQMADRHYLIKLPFLYEEFKEGGVSIFANELDLLQATPDFWGFIKQRFVTEYGNVDRYLRDHFRVRWGIDRDLDREAIERNIKYLQFILDHHEADYQRYLSYEGIKEIISEIRKLEGTEKNSESPYP
jgi:hypothetical protein